MTLMDQLTPWKTSVAARCFNMIVVVGSYKRTLAATSRSVQAFGQNLDKVWHEQVPTNRVQEYCPHEYEIADTLSRRQPTVSWLNPASERNEYPAVTQTLHLLRRTRAFRHAELVCRARTSCLQSGGDRSLQRETHLCIAVDLESEIERMMNDIIVRPNRRENSS